MRPDKSGFVLSFEQRPQDKNPLLRSFIAARANTADSSPLESDLFNQVRLFLEQAENVPLWAGRGEQLHLIYPGPQLLDAILRPYGTQYRNELKKALRLREYWGFK